MKTIISLEEAALTAISVYFLTKFNLGLPAWIWLLLFFSPDFSMLGYLAGTRAGAFTYNLVHHRGIALVIVAIGILGVMPLFLSVGILLFAHSSFDRMLGYGLKHNDDFKHTHLGRMGQEKILTVQA